MAATYADVDQKNALVLEHFDGNPWEDEPFRSTFEMTWIFHDNALDGVVLDYAEIKQAVDGQIVPEARLVPAFQEIVNYSRALKYIREESQKSRIDVGLETLKWIHGILVENLPNQVAGRYRKDTPLHRSYYHEIAPPEKISYQMRKLLEHLKSAAYKSSHPVQQAASVHFRLMSVFPFPDISGKVARLLMNLQLMHAGYLPAVIPDVERQHYYEALRGPESALVDLVADALYNSLSNIQKYFLAKPG